MKSVDKAPSKVRRAAAIVISVIAIGAALYTGSRYLDNALNNPLSQDAVINARSITISAAIPGRVQTINVEENASVKQGEILFTLDQTPYKLQLAQAEADLEVAQAALEDRRRAIAAAQSNAAIASEQITRARTNLALATQTLARLEALRPKGYVSAQQVDDAATLKRDAETSLKQAIEQEAAAKALVSDEAAAEALVKGRQAAVALAKRALDDTVIRAPFDGKVVGLTMAPGEYVLPGQSIFTLIKTAEWFATATYVETELPGIRVGNCATVYALADRNRAMKGRVEGIGWGVVSEELINLPRKMPLIPKSLDWVRIAQRFPVQVRLLDPIDDLMRVGASATVTVHHGTDC